MDKKRILYNTILVIIIMSINKGFGFFRESLVAAEYGASLATDSFYYALSLSGIVLIITNSFKTIYKRQIVEVFYKKEEKYFNDYCNKMITFISVISLFISIVVFIFAKQFINIIGGKLPAEQIPLVILLFRIALCYAILKNSTGIYQIILDVKGKFIASSFYSYIFNACTIVFLLFFAREDNIVTYALVYSFSVLLSVLYLRFFTRKSGFKRKLEMIDFKDKDIVENFKLSLPLMLGSATGYINTMVDRLVAAGLPVGTISSLTYAGRLTSVFSGLIMSTVFRVIIPDLTKYSIRNQAKLNGEYSKVINYVMAIATPAAVGFIIFSKSIVMVVYEHGAFNISNTVMVSEILIIYGAGLFFNSINGMMTRILTILKKTKSIMYVSTFLVGLNILLNLILVSKYQHKGLAFASLVVGILGTFIYSIIINKLGNGIKFLVNLKSFIKIAISSGVMGFVSYYYSIVIYDSMFSGKIYTEIIGMLSIIVIAAITYLVMLYITRSQELNNFLPKKFKMKI